MSIRVKKQAPASTLGALNKIITERKQEAFYVSD
jgi:hypothetical protein